jgi:hypothetical protein
MPEQLKLWILRPKHDGVGPWKEWYDKAFGFVVCTTTEADARKFAASECGDEGEEAWLDDKLSMCEEMKPELEGIIMCDFASA